MRKAIHRKYRPKVRAAIAEMDLEKFRTVSLQSVRTLKAREFIFFHDENSNPFGWMRAFAGNEHLQFQHDTIEESVPDEMLRGIAESLLLTVREAPDKVFITGCSDPRLVNAVRKLTPVKEAPLLIMQLRRENLNREIMRKWAAQAAEWKGKLRFEFVQDCPEEYLDAYADLQNQLLHDMPMDGGPVEYNSWNPEGLRRINRFNSENNQTSYSIFVFDTDGKLVGNSDMVIRRQPLRLQQGMTGLLPEYRGKGLAKILKGLMTERVVQDFPDLDYITTTTSPLNKAMQAINFNIGFTVEKTMYEFVLRQEKLEAFRTDQ